MDRSQEQSNEGLPLSSYPSDTTAHPRVTNGGLNPSGLAGSSSVEGAIDQKDFNYDHIESIAVVAIYDTLQSTPQIVQIPGGPTHQFIEDIASITYKEAQQRGGLIPYTVIREVAENFIHANFNEPVVSIFDKGNTIRFADQGPGIKDKERAQEPGFTSASEPMKKYIRGVGSGLPLVKEILGFSHGTIKIEDNINHGSVVTISLLRDLDAQKDPQSDIPSLTENDKAILRALLPHELLGVTEMVNLTAIPQSTIHKSFSKLETAGILEKVNKKRQLTAKGTQVALSL
ncbi:ATP-binding protein [Anaerotardibacter muris]|uniref:ATP-binding protein n=1 Tax=Anaerotardibacter muris TaxID=2941505 RepID=UPI00203A78AC|nr:ATP-binding protein [Anaerotardibacter muris]